jgi:hypothetical protein
MDVLCYKNTFFQALTRMKILHPQLYDFFPTTFQLPFQFSEFQREHLRLAGDSFKKFKNAITWIIKPRSGCCGNGIRLIQSSCDVLDQSQTAVIQRYVSPYLIDGFKFDFRFYVLIATLEPLTVYLYNEGLARFCTRRYAPPTRDTLDDRFCHLTNTAVNVANPASSRPILELATSVIARICAADRRGDKIWPRIRQIVLLSIVAEYQSMLQNAGSVLVNTKRDRFAAGQRPIDDRHRYFHLIGIDVMLDDRCEPVVLELNDRPSMCVTYEIEQTVKSRLVYDALNVVTIDGEDPGESAVPGGWERLAPVDSESLFGRTVQAIVSRAVQAAIGFHKKMVIRRFGYAPVTSQRRAKKSMPSLPPLHQ